MSLVPRGFGTNERGTAINPAPTMKIEPHSATAMGESSCPTVRRFDDPYQLAVTHLQPMLETREAADTDPAL